MSIGLFGKKQEPIVCYRSRDLSMLMFFNIGRVDAAALLSALETVDEEQTHTIDIQLFAKKICGNFYETFLVFWELFYSQVDPHPPRTEVKKVLKRSEVDSDDEDDLLSLGFLEMPALNQQQQQQATTSENPATGERQKSFTSEFDNSKVVTAITEARTEVVKRKGVYGNGKDDEETRYGDTVILNDSIAEDPVAEAAEIDDDTSDEDAPSHKRKQKKDDDDAESALTEDHQLLRQDSSFLSAATNRIGISEARNVVKDHKGISYNYVIFFLLMLMHYTNDELPLWVFWMFFTLKNEQPTSDSFLRIIDLIWCTPPPKLLKVLEKMKKKVGPMVLSVMSANELVPNKLKYFDVATGGVWTRPLRLLRKEIRNNIVGPAFWRRIDSNVRATFHDLDTSYDTLREPYRLSKWARSDFFLIGERREARKDIRKFIRLYRLFIAMPLEETHEAYGRVRDEKEFEDKYESSKKGTFSFLFGKSNKKRPGSSKKSISDFDHSGKSSRSIGTSVGSSKQRSIRDMKKSLGMEVDEAHCLPPISIFSSENKKDEPILSPQQQQDQLIPLDILYKDSLRAPLEDIYSKVSYAQRKADELLKQCDDEVNYSEYLERQLADAREAQEWLARKNTRREVVIDVSSSSDSNSEEEDGSYGDEDEEDDEEGYSGSEYSDSQRYNNDIAASTSMGGEEGTDADKYLDGSEKSALLGASADTEDVPDSRRTDKNDWSSRIFARR